MSEIFSLADQTRIGLLTSLIEKEPNDGQLLIDRGACHARLGRYVPAVKDFQAALKLINEPPASLYIALAEACVSLRGATKALGYAEQALAHPKLSFEERFEALRVKTSAAEEAKEFEKVVETTTELLENFPVLGEADFGHRANALVNLSRFDEALADIARGMEIAPTNPYLYTLKAHALKGAKRYHDLRDTCNAGLKLPECNSEHALFFYTALGDAEYQLHNDELAIEYCTKAIEISPKLFVPRMKRAQAHERLGHTQAALDDITAYLELRKDDADAHYVRGDLLSRLGRQKEATEAYRQSMLLDPSQATARKAFYAHVGMQDKDRNVQEVCFTNAIEADDAKDPTMLMARALTRVRLRKYEEAISDLDRSIALNPMIFLTYILKAKALKALGRVAEAADAVRRAELLGAAQEDIIRIINTEQT